jgi:hypothetical protein
MSDRHIVCIEPASGRGEPVVVEVQQEGSHALDVRLVGCEGENPYVTTSKTRSLPTFLPLTRFSQTTQSCQIEAQVQGQRR